MSAEVWGTYAVNDHLHPQAFIRGLLLFDRLVVPYPANEAERERWQRPNPKDSNETWDPDLLDDLLELLGTQDTPGHEGAELTWTAQWDLARWQTSRRQMADIITTYDAFYATRQILAEDDDLPRAVEAVATYPSEQAWRDDSLPTTVPPNEPTVATALLMLARPLLLPRIEKGKERDSLKEVFELVTEPGYQRARTAFHDWARDFVGPLQSGQPLNDASIRFARKKLDRLLADERRIVATERRKKKWTVVGSATMVVQTTASIGVAIAFPPAAPFAVGLGILGSTATFAGWIAGQRAATPAPRPLNGASMFVMADTALSTRHRRTRQ